MLPSWRIGASSTRWRRSSPALDTPGIEGYADGDYQSLDAATAGATAKQSLRPNRGGAFISD